MTRIIPPVAVALSLILGTPALAQTVILVRHAEKADQSTDPVLSEAGEARARALAERLSDQRPRMIIRTPLRRNGMTAAGLTEQTEDGRRPTVAVVPIQGRSLRQHVDEVVRLIREQSPDTTVLVVGHSNTVPLIARALGQATPNMSECEYDRLLTLRLQGDSASGVTTRYGAPSDCSAAD